jgi:hypothetical protein
MEQNYEQRSWKSRCILNASHIQRKDFWKEEINSYKYEGMIAMTLKCNKFIDTYGVIAMLLILVVALLYSFL